MSSNKEVKLTKRQSAIVKNKKKQSKAAQLTEEFLDVLVAAWDMAMDVFDKSDAPISKEDAKDDGALGEFCRLIARRFFSRDSDDEEEEEELQSLESEEEEDEDDMDDEDEEEEEETDEESIDMDDLTDDDDPGEEETPCICEDGCVCEEDECICADGCMCDEVESGDEEEEEEEEEDE